MPDPSESPLFNTDMFPDAERKTICFYAKVNIRSLRKVLDAAKLTSPELEIEISDVWDAAKVYFPEEFGKTGTPQGPVNRARVQAAWDAEHNVVPKPETSVPPGLSCRFCGKPLSSTSGKTLHEKSCKKRTDHLIDPVSGEVLDNSRGDYGT